MTHTNRLAAVLLAGCLVATAAGCGGDEDETAPTREAAPMGFAGADMSLVADPVRLPDGRSVRLPIEVSPAPQDVMRAMRDDPRSTGTDVNIHGVWGTGDGGLTVVIADVPDDGSDAIPTTPGVELLADENFDVNGQIVRQVVLRSGGGEGVSVRAFKLLLPGRDGRRTQIDYLLRIDEQPDPDGQAARRMTAVGTSISTLTPPG